MTSFFFFAPDRDSHRLFFGAPERSFRTRKQNDRLTTPEARQTRRKGQMDRFYGTKFTIFFIDKNLNRRHTSARSTRSSLEKRNRSAPEFPHGIIAGIMNGISSWNSQRKASLSQSHAHAIDGRQPTRPALEKDSQRRVPGPPRISPTHRLSNLEEGLSQFEYSHISKHAIPAPPSRAQHALQRVTACGRNQRTSLERVNMMGLHTHTVSDSKART